MPDFHVALESINRLIAAQQWKLHRCHRDGIEILHYFVTDDSGRVLTPTFSRRKIGLTLNELLMWLEQHDDPGLTTSVRTIRTKLISTAPRGTT